MLISAVIMLFGLSLRLGGNDSAISKMLAFTGLLMLLMILSALYINPRRFYKKRPKLRDEYNLDFDDQGITFHTEITNPTVPWGKYSFFKENKGFFYLIYGKMAFTIIPKRVFSSSESEEMFRKLIRKKLRKK
jgi:hypothetical protein